MKKRIYILTTLLLISSLAVAALGAYIKYEILKPMGIEREESIIAMPFVYMTDDGLKFMVQMYQEMAAETEPATEDVPASTEESIAGVTVETMPPETTEETVPETQAPTAAATEAPTEPVYEPVDDSWFDDALFIGDSRLHALRAYNRMGEATYFSRVGLNIYNVFGAWESDRTYSDMPLEELLQKKTFGKVLINLGLNGCEYDHAYIRSGFEKLINMIRQYQPDAKIILMDIMMVSEGYSKLETYFSIENLSAINEILASFADGETIFYMDNNAWIVNEKGYLPYEVTNDGAHLIGSAYAQWADWIRLQCGTYPVD